MIHDIDESLRALLRRVLQPDGGSSGDIDIAFEAPTEDWAGKRQGPAVSCYLYGLREDLDRRQRQWQDVLDDDGTVMHRILPARRYKLSYLVTTWAGRPEDEHRLLAAVIDDLARLDSIPADVMPASLRELDRPLGLAVALPQYQDRPFPDVWGSLGINVRPALDLIVNAPFGPRTTTVGPPVTEEPRVDFFDTAGDLLGSSDTSPPPADDRRSPWPIDDNPFSGEQVAPRRQRPTRRPGSPR